MANLDGSPSDRALAAGELVRKISPDMQLFYRAKPVRAEAAVCLNNYSNIMWQCMRQPWHYIPSRSYVGAYKAIYRKHLPADYIHPDEISQGKLEKYRVLYLPFSFMLPRQAAAEIEKFVRQGGVVLAEARTAWNDETGYCGDAVPGFGLENVFGCREKGAEGVGEDARVPVRILRNHPALPTLQEGDMLQGAFFREALELLSPDAEVVGVFEDGSPAITVHRYGEGWAVFAGTMLSLAYYKFDDINTGKLLQGLLDLAQIDPPVLLGNVSEGVEIEPRLLEFSDHDGKAGYLFFAFNHSQAASPTENAEPVKFGLQVAPGDYHVSDVVREQNVPASWSNGHLQLEAHLAPGEIWLVKILAA
jgi:beta-galactosidase